MGQAKNRGTLEQRMQALWAESGVKPLTPERYNAFIAWTRTPIAGFVTREDEFFATEGENLIGVILMDRTDRDFGYVVLGRDEKGRFRATEVDSSMTKTQARHALFAKLKEIQASGETMFPQGKEPEDKAGVDLFSPLAAEDQLHFAFKLLRDGNHWIPARSMMSEMMRHFTDVDGNFVQQFQTDGFDARIWELYLYASLLEMGLFVSKPDPAPDFLVTTGGKKKVFIEAVTVGPSANDTPVEEERPGPFFREQEEVRELLKAKMPIRFGSALWSKLNRKKPYWEMEHVKGHPLVFAIADFHEQQSMMWSSSALLQYLYGVTHDFNFDERGQLIISAIKLETFEHEGKKIPAGFFLQPNSEHISAVLFTSSGTISKFNRMGRLAGFGLKNQRMIRSGVAHKHDDNSALPKGFVFEIEQGVVTETWAEGLSMFHNPKALHPVDVEMFPGIAHHRFVDGQIHSLIPEFHPYSSFTWNVLAVDDLHDKELPAMPH